jgi:hypothetical protein
LGIGKDFVTGHTEGEILERLFTIFLVFTGSRQHVGPPIAHTAIILLFLLSSELGSFFPWFLAVETGGSTSTSNSILIPHKDVKVFLELERDLERIVHVGGLFEPPSTLEPIRLGRVTRTSNPSNPMVCIIRKTFHHQFRREQLHTVVTDHDGRNITC